MGLVECEHVCLKLPMPPTSEVTEGASFGPTRPPTWRATCPRHARPVLESSALKVDITFSLQASRLFRSSLSL